MRTHLHSPAFAASARSPHHPKAFTRTRKLPLPTLVAAMLSFRGGSVQSELDGFFAHLGTTDPKALASDRALAKARSKLNVPALWDLNDRLIDSVARQGQERLFKNRRLVCADGTVLAPAQRACSRTHNPSAPVQRALGLYLAGNEMMLHLAVGSESEGERQMLFDAFDRLRPGDVLVLDRGYPASWLVQALVQRGIDFVIRCDSTSGWGAVRRFMRGHQSECWDWLSPTDAAQANTWELDGPAQMRVRLVRHISPSGRIRVLVTSLAQEVANVAELRDIYHGRWRIEEAFKRLKHRLGLESVSGLSQHALLVDVAIKVLADNLAALLNMGVVLGQEAQVSEDEVAHSDAAGNGNTGNGNKDGASGTGAAGASGAEKASHKQANRSYAAKLFSRWIGQTLLSAMDIAQRVHEWVATLSRNTTRFVPGRSTPRNPNHNKPHPSQAYKRAA